VKGIKNLRVADASVIRNLLSDLINTPVMMIAEKVSDMIKQYRGRPTKYLTTK
jgi:choline dehydrogenase